MHSIIFFMIAVVSVFAQESDDKIISVKSSFFSEKLACLLAEEKWEEIVFLGEKEIQGEVSSIEKFSILDQLVSSYFRLGLFEEAIKNANKLVLLGEGLGESYAVVDSLYKLSAALRGVADSEKNPLRQREVFSASYAAIEKAFAICEEKCSENKALKARVLFNRGAVCCDDPIGDIFLGITYYKEAILLFKELEEVDYTQRMLIRLGKAYFLIKDLEKSREVIEELRLERLEKRTYMHLLYLEAQVCLEEGNEKEASLRAWEGKEIAILLHASHDLKRFESLMDKVSSLGSKSEPLFSLKK